MSTVDFTTLAQESARRSKPAASAGTRKNKGKNKVGVISAPEPEVKRERFIPVTRYALMDRLTARAAWPRGRAKEARRLFRYLDYWRHQQYNARLLDLEPNYEPFSPDSDLLATRKFTKDELVAMQARVIEQTAHILEQANYERVDTSRVELIITEDSTYGLDFELDMDAFEEVLIYYRGKSTRTDTRRLLKKFYRKEEFEVPIYRRLCLLFKLKPAETRVAEVMAKEKLDRKAAEKKIRKLRALLPPQVKDEYIYLKLFKNIPTNDLEMIFPNTQVRFRLLDKLKLGGGASFGVGAGVYGTITKAALLTNPYTALPALAGFGAVLFRQAMNFVNQKQRYMVVMAQNLYFHSMADNRGVMIKLADRAAEEDVKEEILLYSVMAKETVNRKDLPDIDRAIEQYLQTSFGVNVDFDLNDALRRLLEDGLVTEAADGTFTALPPREAALHLDAKWDVFLDNLPDPGGEEGEEFEGTPGAAVS